MALARQPTRYIRMRMTVCRSLRSQIRKPGGRTDDSVLRKRPNRNIYRIQATVVAAVVHVTAIKITVVPKQESDVGLVYALGLGSPGELEDRDIAITIGDMGVGLDHSFFDETL